MAAATQFGAVDVEAYCLENGAELDEALSYMADSQETFSVFRHLVEAGAIHVTKYADIYVDKTGDLLGLAADQSNHPMVRYMLEKGAEPNRRLHCEDMKTTLACAAWHSDEEMVELLLDHGAKLAGSGALVMAAQEGKLAMVRMLLARGADVNGMGTENPGDKRTLRRTGTALHKAIERNHVDVVDVLLQAGADLRKTDGMGRTPEEVGRLTGINDSVLQRLKTDQ